MAAKRLGSYFAGLSNVRGKAGAAPWRRTLQGLVLNKRAGSAYDEIAAQLFALQDVVAVDRKAFVQTELDATISNSGQDVVEVTAPRAFVQTSSFFIKVTEAIPVSVRAFTQTLNGEGDTTGNTGVLAPTGATNHTNWGAIGSADAWTNLTNVTSSNNSRSTTSATNAALVPLLALTFDLSSLPIGGTVTGMVYAIETADTFGSMYSYPRFALVKDKTDTTAGALHSSVYADVTPTSTETTYSFGASTTPVPSWVTKNSLTVSSSLTTTDLRSPNAALGYFGGQQVNSQSVDYATLRVYWARAGMRVYNRDTVTFSTPLEITLGRGTQSSTGWTSGGTAAIVNWSSDTSTNANNALTQSDTQASLIFTGSNISDDVYVSNFGFAIPSGAAIDGVEFDADLWSNLSTNNRLLVYQLADVDNGTVFNGSVGTWSWYLSQLPSTDTDSYINAEQYGRIHRIGSYGWGGMDVSGTGARVTYAPFTPTLVNSSAFGATFFVTNEASTSSGTVFVDHVRLNVYYSDGGITVTNSSSADIVAVPLLSFVQTTYPALIVEKQLVALKTFAQTLFTPSVNAKEVITVSVLAQAQTFFDATVSASSVIAVPVLAQVQTLLLPLITEKQFIGLKTFTQTTFPALIVEKQLIGLKTFTQTLLLPLITEKQLIGLKTFTQTLLVPNVNAREQIAVPVLTQTQTLFDPNVSGSEVIAVPVLTQTQTLFDATVDAETLIDVPVLAQVQTLLDVLLPSLISVDTCAFTQILFVPIVVEGTGTTEGTGPRLGGGNPGKHPRQTKTKFISTPTFADPEPVVISAPEAPEAPVSPTPAAVAAITSAVQRQPLTKMQEQLLALRSELSSISASEAAAQAAAQAARLAIEQEEEQALLLVLLAASRKRSFIARRL